MALTGGAVYGGKKALLMPYTGVGTAKEVSKFLEDKQLDVKTILLSEKCSYDFNKNKVEGKFIDHNYDNSKSYFRDISSI